ncbi:tyrosyl-tRNA synthetase mitochondrial precursor [Talaromyces proteolyticus]|uniref:Tyrosine--tRNA ligase n=1 Tax=Talaromyces proteolyticus TaxID=1131652 RepID=A0AAD4KJF3_9EURO|nr:tyrosyl-tRNA synthetase mitochondrial precursor [Talaromyces proteolyticus]KAH8693855.1 tyrosyl-tRNA synthetase mitochondrial precursor [Talaromyces proteolyticus]
MRSAQRVVIFVQSPASCQTYCGRRQLHTRLQRPSVTGTSSVALRRQKRFITQQWIANTKQAKAEWDQWAVEIKEGKRKSFVQLLDERGLLHQVVGLRELLDKILTERRVGFYAGVDPTAPSLHVGHMIPFMVLVWAFHWGYPITFLLGGSTAKFGDPTGRLEERKQEHRSVRTANIASMHMQLKKLSASMEKYGERHGYEHQWAARRALTNNNVWWNKVPFIDVLRDLGMHMRLGPMLGRDTVKTRLEGKGMSFAEFCYPLMQAWDWFHMFRKGTQVQVGGADQYGNILFGMEAVKQLSKNTAIEIDRRNVDEDVEKPIGITTPLLTTASGEKFGKSAGNAIWLDKDLTSTFELYAYFVRTPDDQVERYLKLFTFLPLEEITKIVEKHTEDPSKRVAQHTLAREFLELVHGRQEAETTALQHQQLFRPRSSTAEPTPPPTRASNMPESFAKKPEAGFTNVGAGNIYAPQVNYTNMQNQTVKLPRSLVLGQTLNKVLYSAGLVSSNNEGHRLIANNGASIGSRPGDSGPMSDALAFTPIRPWVAQKTEEFLIEGKLIIFKIGKWKLRVVELVDDAEFEAQGLKAPGWEEFKLNKGKSADEDGSAPRPGKKSSAIRYIKNTPKNEEKSTPREERSPLRYVNSDDPKRSA